MATATSKIHKPEKVLRDDLADRKAALESGGWEFRWTQTNEKWGAFISKDGEVFAVDGFDKIGTLIAHLEGMKESEAKNKPSMVEKAKQLTEKPAAEKPLANQEFIEKFMRDGFFDNVSGAEKEIIRFYAENEGWFFEKSKTGYLHDWLGQRYNEQAGVLNVKYSGGKTLEEIVIRATGASVPDEFQQLLQKERSETFDDFATNHPAFAGTDAFKWTFTEGQVRVVTDFNVNQEITAIYETREGAVEVEYIDKKKGHATSVFFDREGMHHNKRRREFGASLSESLLSAEEFFAEFPIAANTPLSEEENPTPEPETESEARGIKCLLENYFGDYEIKEVKELPKKEAEAVLTKNATNDCRGHAGGNYHYKTLKGKVSVWVDEPHFRRDPDAIITVRKLAGLFVDNLPAETKSDQPTQDEIDRMAALEIKGWKFAQTLNGWWNGEKLFEGDPEPTRVLGGNSVSEICELAEGVETAKQPNEPGAAPEIDYSPNRKLPPTVVWDCRYELGDEEVLKRAATLVASMREKEEEIARFAELKKKHQEKLEEIDTRAKAAREAVDTRVEWRKTECYQEYDYLLQTVSVHRPDTNDLVNVRSMTREEIQKRLFA